MYYSISILHNAQIEIQPSNDMYLTDIVISLFMECTVMLCVNIFHSLLA